MKIKLLITLSILLLSVASALFAEEKDYTHILVLGADQTVSNSETNKFNPVLTYYYNFLEKYDNWYGQFYLTTTDVKCTLSHKSNAYSLGIIPQFNHTIYGAYYLYDRGVFYESRTFAGNNAGIEFFLKYDFSEILNMRLSYLPDYHFYSKLKKDNPLYGVKDETEIELPDNHWQHSIILESSIGRVSSKNLDRVHHGIKLDIKYKLTKRVGWESYNDIDPATGKGEVSNQTLLQRFYFNLGAYYEISRFNLLLDVAGSIQDNIDRTDAEQIGSFVANHGFMPGYFCGEFLHNRYIISWLQLGMPLPAWNSRLQTGFAVLYMPYDNDVTGVEDYPERIYKSITFNYSVEMFDLLPVFFYYAYGIDADRINASDNTEKKGNHEFMVYVLAAFY